MYFQLTPLQLEFLLQDAAELGALKALCSVGKVKPYINKAQAFKKYGRVNVEKWIAERLITPIKDGTKSDCWRMDRLELHSLAKALDLLRFLLT